MFTVAYINQKNDKSFHNQTIRVITLGQSDKTNTLMFYHPITKKVLSNARCTIDETLVAGPTFGLNYDGSIYINKYCDSTTHQLKVPTYKPNEEVQINK